MESPKIASLRQLALKQIDSIVQLGGKELEGTALGLELELARINLSGGLADEAVGTTTVTLNPSTGPKAPEARLSPEVSDNLTVAEEAARAAQAQLDSAGWSDAAASTSHRPVDFGYDDLDDWDDMEWDGEDELDEPALPAGFDSQEDFQDFLADQADFIPDTVDQETGEITLLRPQDVAGVRVDADGHLTEIGSFDESLEKVTEMMEADSTILDEETGEELYRDVPAAVEEICLAFTRQDGNTFTEEELEVVLGHPVSVPMLRAFGSRYTFSEGSTPSQKLVRFAIDNENATQRKTSQGIARSSYMSFGGCLPFPGLGLVKSEVVVV